MNRLMAALCTIFLAACATTHQVALPQDGFSIDGVDPGDRVEIVLKDGTRRTITVTRVDTLGLHGSDDFFFYPDMQSVSVKEPGNSRNAWWLLLAILAIALVAEPDDSGYGPLCLRSSEGGPCLP